MSIWDNQASDGSLVRPGTPEVTIRLVHDQPPTYTVNADGVEVHRTEAGYLAAHRWAQNTYQLTSTPMIAVYADFERAMLEEFGPPDADTAPPPEQGSTPPPQPGAPNRFRKPGAEPAPPPEPAEPLLKVIGKMGLSQDWPPYITLTASSGSGLFVAEVTQTQLERLQRDPNVRSVELEADYAAKEQQQ